MNRCNHTTLDKATATQLALTPPLVPLNHACMRALRRNVFLITCKRRSTRSRRVVDIFLFGFEADVLEIRLLESQSMVVHTYVVEARFDHHGYDKPCVFRDVLQKTPRFSRFANVTSFCMERPTDGRAIEQVDWSFENAQERAVAKLAATLEPDTLVAFGHVDEVPTHQTWWQIANCKGRLPTNLAIVNLHGHVSYAGKSPFAAAGQPYTWGSPAVMRAGNFTVGHARGGYRHVWLTGGTHLTNYCFAGNRVLKEWTATEARPDQMRQAMPSCKSQVKGCRRAATRGLRLVRGIAHLPIALQCNRARFPEFWGRSDPRLA